MIEMRRSQLSFGDGLIAEEASDLREGWMTYLDDLKTGQPLGFDSVTRRQSRAGNGFARTSDEMQTVIDHFGGKPLVSEAERIAD